VADRGHPSALRWLIGVELTNFRKRANLTQAQTSEKSGVSVQKLSHLETGERRQYPADIAKVLSAYRVAQHDVDRLTTLAGLADSSTWWGAWGDVVPDWLSTYVGLERLATHEFTFEPIVLPGVLQTPDYARELTRSGRRVRQDHSERVVEVRTERARRLTDSENLLSLHAVVAEAALRLRVGTPDIVRAQYEHLIQVSQLPNVTLQVTIPERGPHGAPTGQFIVLDFDHARSIAYVELQDGAMYVSGPGEVDTYKESTRNLADVALSPAESVDFIVDLIKKT
jgi:transcriptional regulator with XRE-family HTH domain